MENNVVVMIVPLVLIGLQVTRTDNKSRTKSISGQIGLFTSEKPALEGQSVSHRPGQAQNTT